MKKAKRKIYGLFLMIPGLLLILAGVWQIIQIPNRVEYIVPAPVFSAEESVREPLNELAETLAEYEWSVSLRKQDVEASSARKGKTAVTLYAVSERYFDLHYEQLAAGRYIAGDDLSGSLKYAVINKKGAETFFPGLEPVGQKLTLCDRELEIIGVVSGGRRLGETTEALVWIPVTLADACKLEGAAMEICVRSGSAARNAALKKTLTQWTAGGSFHEYSRMRFSALMPLWLLGFAAAYYLLKFLTRKLLETEKRLFLSAKEKLNSRYARQMKASLAGTAALGLLAAALWFACLYGFMAYTVLPLYTFTDWIPEAFVDPASVAATVRSLLTAASPSVILRSRTVTAAELSGAWITWGSLLFAAGFAARAVAPARKKAKQETSGT